MERGQYRVAGSMYRRQAKADPADPWAPLGVARAQAATGRCAAALETMEAAHAGPAWDHRLSLAAATCHARQGDHADAAYFVDEALQAEPDNLAVLARALVLAHEAGDGQQVASLELAIEDLDPDSQLAGFAAALRGLEEGDGDRVAYELLMLRDTAAWRTWSDLLATRAWLDLDDPVAAIDQALTRWTSAPRPLLLPWLAEAHRRAGHPEEADTLLTSPKQRNRTDLVNQALLLRVEADALAAGEQYGEAATLAELQAQARTLLAAHPLDPEVLASAWYVASLAGDQASARDLADRLALVRDDAPAELARLVPIHLRTP